MKKSTTKIDYRQFIEEHIITCDISYRGGVLKIDVSELFPSIDPEDAIMGASQNYLGGGIAGAITGGAMFMPDDLSKKDQKIFFELKEAIKQYFYDANNGGGDDYMQDEVIGRKAGGYLKNQTLPVSAY